MGELLSYNEAVGSSSSTRQLGLGNRTPFEIVTVPTEVVLWRFTSATTQTKCLNVSAGARQCLARF